MRINQFSNTPQMNLQKRCNNPSFKSQYEINGDSISSRQQVFALGTLMNNFWIYDARNTFFDIKRKNVMGKFNIKVNDLKDHAFEQVMQNNRIEYKKLDINSNNSYYNYYY